MESITRPQNKLQQEKSTYDFHHSQIIESPHRKEKVSPKNKSQIDDKKSSDKEVIKQDKQDLALDEFDLEDIDLLE
jgi:copper homeostasis protein CutC